ncbi:MAG: hypothetical protein HQ582_24265 [Planctomycetes bacterium]|nr:hypothetical protein [Planctomycetota bacterium]
MRESAGPLTANKTLFPLLDNPDWENSHRVHDWRNHVSRELRGLWERLARETRLALMLQALESSEWEEWD